uniref:Uncharacterized protein n=1 Tax=Anguilla anguilla TaxID=7936 RepID=A0A0E9X1W3_ANGAN
MLTIKYFKGKYVSGLDGLCESEFKWPIMSTVTALSNGNLTEQPSSSRPVSENRSAISFLY